MGGIGHATAGWLAVFLTHKLPSWEVHVIFSTACPAHELRNLAPGIEGKAEILILEAGLIDAHFDQVVLPTILERQRIDLYFNTCFTIPAVKTTKYQAAVVHDVVF